MGGRILVNDILTVPEEARVPVLDRGFLFGDSVFETLRVYDGVPFALDAHLVRLRASGRRVGFELPWDDAALRTDLCRTIQASGLTQAYARLIVTRGLGPITLDPSDARDPTRVIIVVDLPPLPEALYQLGRSARLVSVQRNAKLAIDPEAKTGNYMNNVLAAGEARRQGADEAIMLAADGRVAEGSSANVFAWIDGTWVTPEPDVGLLSGITRRTVLALSEELGVPVRQTSLWPQELARAEELFLCSSVRELVPVVRLDDAPIADSVPGQRTQALHAAYRAHVAGYVRAFSW